MDQRVDRQIGGRPPSPAGPARAHRRPELSLRLRLQLRRLPRPRDRAHHRDLDPGRTDRGVAAGALLTVLVGLSRIYLRAHYASDVLAGEALAVAMYALATIGTLASAITTPLSYRQLVNRLAANPRHVTHGNEPSPSGDHCRDVSESGSLEHCMSASAPSPIEPSATCCCFAAA